MSFIQRFFRTEAAGGIILMIAAACAMLAANTPLSPFYESFLVYPLALVVGDLFVIDKPLILWVNDGLMALFFLVIGMEIKREIIRGELSTRSQALLPVVGAAGGVALPAFIYLAFNFGTDAARGWAVPTATDIAFSLGVLALFGKRVPVQLKIFLMAVAVIDDLVAVAVIALFYTDELLLGEFAVAIIFFIGLCGLNRAGVKRVAPYMLLGFIMWVYVLKSGVHATIAGVLLGFVIPLRLKNAHGERISESLEHALHPWVAFGVIPLFAFVNAGVPLSGIEPGSLFGPVPLGLVLGLFLGKQLGIFSAVWLLVKYGFAQRLEGVSWLEFYAVCMIAGIGFTMSLFIGTLAFGEGEAMMLTRLGVTLGSLASAACGYALLDFALKKREREAA